MVTCKDCIHFIGAGDWNLCCTESHDGYPFGFLCYEDTPACEKFCGKEDVCQNCFEERATINGICQSCYESIIEDSDFDLDKFLDDEETIEDCKRDVD